MASKSTKVPWYSASSFVLDGQGGLHDADRGPGREHAAADFDGAQPVVPGARVPTKAANGRFRAYVPPDCSSVAAAGVAPAGANNLCASTSPPPGEPGQDTSSPELLYARFPPAVPAVDGDAHPPSRPRGRWRVPSVPVLSALIAVVLL